VSRGSVVCSLRKCVLKSSCIAMHQIKVGTDSVHAEVWGVYQGSACQLNGCTGVCASM